MKNTTSKASESKLLCDCCCLHVSRAVQTGVFLQSSKPHGSGDKCNIIQCLNFQQLQPDNSQIILFYRASAERILSEASADHTRRSSSRGLSSLRKSNTCKISLCMSSAFSHPGSEGTHDEIRTSTIAICPILRAIFYLAMMYTSIMCALKSALVDVHISNLAHATR